MSYLPYREVRDYGFQTEAIKFPIRNSTPYAWVSLDQHSISRIQSEDCNVMLGVWWMDDKNVLHRTFHCGKCKITFFGSRLEDFSHECDDGSLKDVVTYRCGHSEKGFPSANEAEREHNRRMALIWLCFSCSIEKMREIARQRKEERNAK